MSSDYLTLEVRYEGKAASNERGQVVRGAWDSNNRYGARQPLNSSDLLFVLKVVYLLDAVRALEAEMRARLEDAGERDEKMEPRVQEESCEVQTQQFCTIQGNVLTFMSKAETLGQFGFSLSQGSFPR